MILWKPYRPSESRRSQRCSPRPGRLHRTLLVLCAAALAAPVGGCRSLGDLLLFPTQDPIRVDAERRVLSIGPGAASDSADIELFVRDYGGAGPPQFTVLSLTGNAGRAETMVSYSARLVHGLSQDLEIEPCFRVVAVNYPGYGQSTGPCRLDQLGPAALVAYRELAAESVGPIVVHGLSMGTTAALHLAAALADTPHPPTALIIEKPPNLWRQIVWGHGWWNLWLLSLPAAWGLPESARNDLNAARAVSIPALFIVATLDTVVPPRYARSIAAAYAGPKRVVEQHAGHHTIPTDSNTPERLDGLRWLWRAVERQGPAAPRTR